MDTPIDTGKDKQWKHDKEFVKIIKNICFYPNSEIDKVFSLEMSGFKTKKIN